MKSVAWIFALCALVALFYYLGVIKLPGKMSNITELDIPLVDPCLNKNTSGNYALSILFKTSDVPAYAMQKAEIYYDLNFNKDRCFINGYGTKNNYSLIDTISGRRGALIPDLRKVRAKGECVGDTLYLEVFYDTNSNRDCKVKMTFPFSGNNISVLNGTFFEECNNSTGIAKLTKANNPD